MQNTCTTLMKAEIMDANSQPKTKTQLFVEKFLSSSELEGVSQSVSNAYAAVEFIYRSTPALGAFIPGGDIRPHLLRVCVEHSLQKFAALHDEFTHEIRLNQARNCYHLRVYKNGLALTAHYMGAKCERPEARKALYKANLSERNMDLFSFENEEADDFKNIGYAEIMHGGVVRPSNILINIPSRDQTYSMGSLTLAIVSENKAQVEKIVEETPYKLHEITEEIKNGNKKAS